MEVDEQLNRQTNFYAHRFSYSYGLCYETISQALDMQFYPKIYDDVAFFCLSTIPCITQNITELFGRNISDFKNDEFDHLMKTLPLQCPLKCTLQTYDVRFTKTRQRHR